MTERDALKMNRPDLFLQEILEENRKEINEKFGGCEDCWMACNLSCCSPCRKHPNEVLQKVWDETGMVDLWKSPS